MAKQLTGLELLKFLKDLPADELRDILTKIRDGQIPEDHIEDMVYLYNKERGIK